MIGLKLQNLHFYVYSIYDAKVTDLLCPSSFSESAGL